MRRQLAARDSCDSRDIPTGDTAKNLPNRYARSTELPDSLCICMRSEKNLEEPLSRDTEVSIVGIQQKYFLSIILITDVVFQ